MSLAAYPSYKDSGVPWLGQVPAHWEVKPLKHIAEYINRGAAPAYVDESPVFVVNQATFSGGELNREKLRYHDAKPEDIGRGLLKPRDVLLASTGGGVLGKVAMFNEAEGTYMADTHVTTLRFPADSADSRYYYRFFSTTYELINGILAEGSTNQTELRRDALREFVLALPPLAEQQAIAAWLDERTGRIDEAVAAQRALLDTLKEKRRALIAHAVTRGLDPAAPLRNSGIPWLGLVPAHWSVVKIKHIVATPITDGPHETPQFYDEGVPFVSAEAVSSGTIDFEKIRGHISQEDNERYSLKYKPELNDIFMVKSGATTGVSAIVENRTDFNIWSPLAVIRCGPLMHPRYMLSFLRSRHFLDAMALYWSFGTQQNIGMGVIENLECAAPPLAEQQAIAAYLDAETAKLDELAAETERAITLLLEHRTALIAEAVTGKLRVTGGAPLNLGTSP